MIAAIVSIVALIAIGGAVGYFIYKRYQMKILELTTNKAKPVDNSHSSRTHIVNQTDMGSPEVFG